MAWSAIVHTLVAIGRLGANASKWVDYTVTAPVMMAVIALVFGSTSATTVVVAPILLAALMVAAALIEPPAEGGGVFPAKIGVFALLFVLYVLLWVPIGIAVDAITSEGAEVTALVFEGTAPAGPLWAFYFTLFLLFTSFAIVYVVDAWKAISARQPAVCGYPLPADRDFWYVLLSMVSKTSLHLYIGLIVLSQGETLAVGPDDAPRRSDMATVGIGLGGTTAAAVIFGGILFWIDARAARKRL